MVYSSSLLLTHQLLAYIGPRDIQTIQFTLIAYRFQLLVELIVQVDMKAFDINCIVVADPCRPMWNITLNTNVLDGAVNNAPTVEVCQAVCARNTSCTGVDWNPTQPTGRRCWLSGPWSRDRRVGIAGGITRYDIYRIQNCTGRLT